MRRLWLQKSLYPVQDTQASAIFLSQPAKPCSSLHLSQGRPPWDCRRHHKTTLGKSLKQHHRLAAVSMPVYRHYGTRLKGVQHPLRTIIRRSAQIKRLPQPRIAPRLLRNESRNFSSITIKLTNEKQWFSTVKCHLPNFQGKTSTCHKTLQIRILQA